MWPPVPKCAWHRGRLVAIWQATVMGTFGSCSPCHRWTEVVTSSRRNPHGRLYRSRSAAGTVVPCRSSPAGRRPGPAGHRGGPAAAGWSAGQPPAAAGPCPGRTAADRPAQSAAPWSPTGRTAVPAASWPDGGPAASTGHRPGYLSGTAPRPAAAHAAGDHDDRHPAPQRGPAGQRVRRFQRMRQHREPAPDPGGRRPRRPRPGQYANPAAR